MNDTPKDPTAAFAEQLAKQLPVKAAYRDAVKPAAKQTGQLAQDLVKTIQLALAPLQFAGAYQDRLRAFIDRSVRSVPEADRVSPAPQILGPIIEGIRYEPEGTPIDEMFQSLLSASMDAKRLDSAHPAFPMIIKQLSADEARLLSSLVGREYQYVRTVDLDLKTNKLLLESEIVVSDDLPRENLSVPDNLFFYIGHLDKLGLAQFPNMDQAPIIRMSDRRQTGITFKDVLRLSGFGEKFMSACSGKISASPIIIEDAAS